MVQEYQDYQRTQLSYLHDFRPEGECRVVAVLDEGSPIVRIAETYFHPQGGGQKADRGMIGHANVVQVRLNGVFVDHYVDSIEGFVVGEIYPYSLDREWRVLNSVYHSAGHLIASVLEAAFPVKAISAHQWPNEARVEFVRLGSGIELPFLEDPTLIQSKIDRLLQEDHAVTINSNRTDAREVRIGELQAIHCGGTHVAHLKQIKEIKISEIKMKEERIRIRYAAKPS